MTKARAQLDVPKALPFPAGDTVCQECHVSPLPQQRAPTKPHERDAAVPLEQEFKHPHSPEG